MTLGFVEEKKQFLLLSKRSFDVCPLLTYLFGKQK